MEDLEFYKEWCLVFVHYEQEYAIGNYPNNSYKIDLINGLNPNRSLGFLCVVRQREIL